MKRSIALSSLLGFCLTSIGGTLLHFLYEWSGKSVLIAPFSGVNESTWEHMKLFFWPTFIYAIVQSFFFGEHRDFWCIKLRGISLGLILIPIIFYTYNGVIGTSPDWINITIFFISAAISYIYEYKLFKNHELCCRHSNTSLAILCIISLSFIIFTFRTPYIEVFRDPLTNAYGIPK